MGGSLVTEQLIAINVMGRQYQVPDGLTIMGALEWSGYQLVRGCGCRGGFCGACATVYRLPGDYRLKVGLACQTPVVSRMVLAEIPFFPANKAIYNLDRMGKPVEGLLQTYPEITRCLGCNACTKACPQKLKPIDYIAAALRGDFPRAAALSFDCIMCGLCAARCPGELAPQNIAVFVRRYYAKLIRPKPQHLKDRITEITGGQHEASLKEIAATADSVLQKTYAARDFEEL